MKKSLVALGIGMGVGLFVAGLGTGIAMCKYGTCCVIEKKLKGGN